MTTQFAGRILERPLDKVEGCLILRTCFAQGVKRLICADLLSLAVVADSLPVELNN
jgi:hypothetical protein